MASRSAVRKRVKPSSAYFWWSLKASMRSVLSSRRMAWIFASGLGSPASGMGILHDLPPSALLDWKMRPAQVRKSISRELSPPSSTTVFSINHVSGCVTSPSARQCLPLSLLTSTPAEARMLVETHLPGVSALPPRGISRQKGSTQSPLCVTIILLASTLGTPKSWSWLYTSSGLSQCSRSCEPVIFTSPPGNHRGGALAVAGRMQSRLSLYNTYSVPSWKCITGLHSAPALGTSRRRSGYHSRGVSSLEMVKKMACACVPSMGSGACCHMTTRLPLPSLSVMAMWMYLGSFSPPSRLAQEEYAPPRLLTVRLPPGCSAAPVRQLLPFRPPPPRLFSAPTPSEARPRCSITFITMSSCACDIILLRTSSACSARTCASSGGPSSAPPSARASRCLRWPLWRAGGGGGPPAPALLAPPAPGMRCCCPACCAAGAGEGGPERTARSSSSADPASTRYMLTLARLRGVRPRPPPSRRLDFS
mmetsp:Transcript_4889/g.12623  ORF Transcript_4889/g.12623 Transcript_4889/m.12623 type:complete len:478 (+) Transcript_4889:452-1885(+)